MAFWDLQVFLHLCITKTSLTLSSITLRRHHLCCIFYSCVRFSGSLSLSSVLCYLGCFFSFKNTILLLLLHLYRMSLYLVGQVPFPTPFLVLLDSDKFYNKFIKFLKNIQLLDVSLNLRTIFFKILSSQLGEGLFSIYSYQLLVSNISVTKVLNVSHRSFIYS